MFGPWSLIEGTNDDGTFSCALGMQGYVRGLNRTIVFAATRNKPGMRVIVWQGNAIVGGGSPAVITVRFEGGGAMSFPGTMDYSRAVGSTSDSAPLLSALASASSMRIEVQGFIPLTATGDGLADGVPALERCLAGETIPPPETYAPLR